MFAVRLKNGNIVRVSLEELEELLEKKREQIQVQHKKMGKRRVAPGATR